MCLFTEVELSEKGADEHSRLSRAEAETLKQEVKQTG